ncbi:hypothetical protein LIER_39553 [Lithospermum erythrorhizon]|uniref:Reverse transcriptase Ty1/copia-type domain-containing protein n=1 Tax=Lithospermum erythrorhizon TaxID=34254 RepID=A0AAV3QJP4_LITER
MTTVRLFLAVVAIKNCELHQMDVHNAFLHGNLKEKVYMRQPPGFQSRTLGSINVLIYVDDLILSGNNHTALCKFKEYLSRCFHIKDLGVLKYFLGVEVARNRKGLYLCQRKYTLDIIAETGLLVSSGTKVRSLECCVAGCSLSQRQPRPRHSLSGWIVFLGGSPVSWKTRKQMTVSRSSAEAEYRSMATLVCELKWLKGLLLSLGVAHPPSMSLFCDSNSALHLARNPVFHEHQLADIFTKALGRQQFELLLSKLGICDLHAPT